MFELINNNSTAILLAGGRSSRMGRDKASLMIGGENLTNRLVNILNPLVKSIIIMLAIDQKLPEISKEFEEKIIIGRDKSKFNGPLQGIADALEYLPVDSDQVFVLSCDLPYLTSDWLKKMRNSLTYDYDVVCAIHDGIANPLLALYRKRILLKAADLINKGEKKAKSLLTGHKILKLSPQPENNFLCAGINTDEEYKKALTYFRL